MLHRNLAHRLAGLQDLEELAVTRDIETLQGDCASYVEDMLEMLADVGATMERGSCMD